MAASRSSRPNKTMKSESVLKLLVLAWAGALAWRRRGRRQSHIVFLASAFLRPPPKPLRIFDSLSTTPRSPTRPSLAARRHFRIPPPRSLKLADSNGDGDGGAGTGGGLRSEEGQDAGDPPSLFTEAGDSMTRRSASDGTNAVVVSGIPHSLLRSVERVGRECLAGSLSPTVVDAGGEELLRRIVRVGIEYGRKRIRRATAGTVDSDDSAARGALRYPNFERVTGCVSTVHLRLDLIPILDERTFPKHCSDLSPSDYRIVIEGTSDAALSRGLLAIVSETFEGGQDNGEDGRENDPVVTAADVLELDPEALTDAMRLRSTLSRGRNDGVASMAKAIQRQIRVLIGDVAMHERPVVAIRSSHENLSGPSAKLAQLKARSEGFPRYKLKVAMLLSGGVDSSVALHLLLREGFDVTAFYLRIWLEDELSHLGVCPWEDDLQVCKAVCEHAGKIPLETVSLGEEYRDRVVAYTVKEALRGRTPNPDIMCNSRVKFGCFLEYIENSGMQFDYVASGHYARLEEDLLTTSRSTEINMKRLFRAPDPIKDQSYFLCTLTQNQLSKVIFPIGGYLKAEVRDMARRLGLPNRDRPDSQGLCFLGKVRFDAFLASYLGKRRGDVVDASCGEVVGRHDGVWFHTVGQRKGIGKALFPQATARGPWYVVAKNRAQDIVYVSNRYDEETFSKARSEFEVEDVRWISGAPPMEASRGEEDAVFKGSWNEARMDLKIRHGPAIVKGNLTLKDDGLTGNIHLDDKDGGLAPGQFVAFYRPGTDECLGAGVISERHWGEFLCSHEELVAA